MNVPLLPEVLVRRAPSLHFEPSLPAKGVLGYVWESRFGPMLIEVEGDRHFVNGERVGGLQRETEPPSRSEQA